MASRVSGTPRYAVQIKSGPRVIETTEPIYTQREAQALAATFAHACAGTAYSARIVPARSVTTRPTASQQRAKTG